MSAKVTPQDKHSVKHAITKYFLGRNSSNCEEIRARLGASDNE